MQLKAMVLEVNNTFDERRMYLLKGSSDSEAEFSAVQQPTAAEETRMKPPGLENTGRFTDAWAKDFHVSPFSSRKGSYALSAYDPFFLSQSMPRPINNTITLSSSKDHPKLVARIFSTGPAIEPSGISSWSKLRFIASWWWVGFVTFPRIVREASKLFFRRKLHIWYRPEVLKDSIGRTETKREKTIEDCFRKFLKQQVEQSNVQIPLKYVAAGVDSKREEIFYPKSITTVSEKFAPDGLQFKVLTPLFYSSVARFARISEFIYSEELRHNDKQRTFWTSDPQKLLEILGEKQIPDSDRSNPLSSNWMSQIYWAILRLLRRSPQYSVPESVLQSTRSLDDSANHDTRSFRLSTLDQFVLLSCKHSQSEEYRTAVSTLLLSDYVTFGIPELIDAFDWCIRSFLCYVSVDFISNWMRTLFSPCIFITVSDALVSCNLLHFWWLVKSML
ncbi:hypothetical protein MMC26_007191 [Xylographa opegraphella]|nr:hypothetical protein [Xylographa opegraphella]